jgi:nitronate monooxygenase
MAGGPTTPKLAAAASNCGALGSLGAALLSPPQIKQQAQQIRELTTRPFAINLFAPNPNFSYHSVSQHRIENAIQSLMPYHDQLGLTGPVCKPPYDEDFERQFEAVLESNPAVLSYTFGHLPLALAEKAKRMGIILIGTATTVKDAEALWERDVDAVVLQGMEAGGHRGIFDPTQDDPRISLMDLITQCKNSPRLKGLFMIAAGGLMNAEDIERVLKAGANAVQLGTAFLTCVEAGTSVPYRRALLASENRKTDLTRIYSGRIARGLVTPFMNEMQSKEILPFPMQNSLTRPLRTASAVKDSDRFLSMWAGTGQGPLWTGETKDLIKKLFPSVI